MSAITPPPRARQALPLNPAKNRRTINVAISWEKPQARVNMTKRTFVRLNMVARPYISDSGAHSKGPAANPWQSTQFHRKKGLYQNVDGYCKCAERFVCCVERFHNRRNPWCEHGRSQRREESDCRDNCNDNSFPPQRPITRIQRIIFTIPPYSH